MFIKMENVKQKFILSVIASASIALSGCAADENKALPNESVELTHVHGLGYTKDGKQILFPAHDGLMAFNEGKWSSIEGPKHDYMGFSMVDNGFYSSGHPEPGSDLKNPLGIVKSADFGKNLEILTLHGEVDFHVMAAGYRSHTIYVFTEESNSQMSAPGLYYSTDEAKNWTQSTMKGLEGQPQVMAVHPTEKSIVAMGTEKGLFVSQDYGSNFKQILSEQITALFYNHQGDLYVGGYNRQAFLQKINSEPNQSVEIKIPTMEKDAVAYIAENPVNAKEWVLATFNKSVFLSSDEGKTWSLIAKEGTDK